MITLEREFINRSLDALWSFMKSNEGAFTSSDLDRLKVCLCKDITDCIEQYKLDHHPMQKLEKGVSE